MSFVFIDGGKINAKHYYGQNSIPPIWKFFISQHVPRVNIFSVSFGSLRKLINFLYTKQRCNSRVDQHGCDTSERKPIFEGERGGQCTEESKFNKPHCRQDKTVVNI